MNVIGTVLEKSEKNVLYVKFKKGLKNMEAEDYEWKCFLVKKYFKDNIVVSLIKLILGILLLVVGSTRIAYRLLGNKSFVSLVVVACLLLGVILTGAGLLAFILNFKCLRNFKDYLWGDLRDINLDDGSGDSHLSNVTVHDGNDIVNKIIRFYDKAH